MNIKEQDEFKLVQILNKYFPDILLETLSECANEIIQAGYVQLQAGEDGLVSCLEMSKIYQQNKNACDSGMLVAMQVAAKAQKALDDSVSPHDKYLKAKEYLLNKIDELEQEKAEAVKEVFDDVIQELEMADDGEDVIKTIKEMREQTLEELK